MGASKKKDQRETTDLPLHEIVAVACFLAGGDRRHVDTEDVAVKANEIAPGRFSWRKYKDQIDLEGIYKHLWDLTKPDKGQYVVGSKSEGWLLTLAGAEFAEGAVDKIKRLLPARESRPRKEEEQIRRERKRMLAEVAYEKIADGKVSEVTPDEAERFFRLNDYVIGAARTRKIQQAEIDFRDDPVLGPVVRVIAEIVREKK